ncbi:hypothetical protein OMCYN_00500 [cyanobiont of Ornithocercus magnificus]|nr:hypothetical protein OMCYN_00500 [cyanobiont of Ornithocercus magnificus]
MAATVALGLPLILLIWAVIRREGSLVRLLTIYWKVASLMAISMLLLTNARPLGFLTAFMAPCLMVSSVWFWVDINEELADLPPWRPLPFTVRFWRWMLSGFCMLSAAMAVFALPCLNDVNSNKCRVWLQVPQWLHQVAEQTFSLVFGGEWTRAIAAFMGYVSLIIYTATLVHWLLIRLPRQGRVAGEF